MNRTFDADARPTGRVLFAAKLVILVVALVAANIAFGWVSWRAATVGGIVGLMVTAFLVAARSAWGNQIMVQPELITIAKGGKERWRIPTQDISALQVKPSAVVIAWQQSKQRRSVVVGRESFSDASWKNLCAALSSLSIKDKGVLSEAGRS